MSRSRLEAALDGVDGFLDSSEAWQLHEAARRCSARSPAPCLVEIGSWRGRSAITLALGLAASGREGAVWAIDPHLHGTEGDLRSNLERAGTSDVVHPLVMYSHEAREQFEDGTVDVLFVDGSHDYDDVLHDIDLWTSALRPGAVVAFNDPGWPGVNGALRARVGRVPSAFRRPWFLFNTLFLEYRPDEAWTRADGRRRRRLFVFLVAKRGFEVLWRWCEPRLPGGVMQVIGLALWGVHRILLRTSPYADR